MRIKNKATSITHPDFKVYYKAIVIKTVRCWHKNGHMDGWSRMENREINPYMEGQSIFDKGAKNNQ